MQSRLEQVDNVNNVMPLYRPYYYIALYENDVDVLYNQIDACQDGLDAAGLSSTLLDAREAAVFFKYCYTRNFDERDIDEKDISELADYIKPNTTYKDEGEQYAYFKRNGGYVAYGDGNYPNGIKALSNGDGDSYLWWLRSPNVTYTDGFRYVYGDGSVYSIGASGSCGVSFGFCV